VATGRVERGIATKGAEVEIVGLGAHFKTTLTGIGKKLRSLLRNLDLQLTRDVPQGVGSSMSETSPPLVFTDLILGRSW
jgi:hypothetical protein